MKIVKKIFELIFTFIVPVILCLLCFEVKTINNYDENNNIINSTKEYNFRDYDFFNTEEITFYKYEYYDLNENIYVEANSFILVNYNISPVIVYESLNEYIYLLLENETKQIYYPSLAIANTTSMIIVNNDDNSVTLMRQLTDNVIINKYGNIIKSIEYKTIKENFISRLLHGLFDNLGIENNVIVEILIIYLLLCLIMFIFWNLIYIPLNFIFNLILWKKELL